MSKKTEKKPDKTSNSLPEFLDEQARLKPGVSLIESPEQLQALQTWLSQREQESNRQVRPAWMEVVQALIHLCQQRLSEGASSADRLSFETHLVARQCTRQRGERRPLATRFVSDEIRRICSHLNEYCQSSENTQQAAVMVGWFRGPNRRGLGLALVERETAEALAASDDGAEVERDPEREFTDINHPSLALSGDPPLRVVSKKSLWIAGGLGFVLACCVSGVLYAFWLKNVNYKPSMVERIRERGTLNCGVDGLLPHFSMYSGHEQNWWGLDVELCRALAAALEVDVKFIKVSASRFTDRVQTLINGEVDILFRNTTHTITRDLNYATTFGPVYFYEKESFLDFSAKSHSEMLQPEALRGKKICVKPGTSNQRTLQQLEASLGFELVTEANGAELSDNKKLMEALRANHTLCDFAFGNYYVLLLLKNDQEKRGAQGLALRHLPDFGLDPLAPVLLVDEQWRRVVSHTVYALMYADELQINSFNLDRVANSQDRIKQRFLQGSDTEKLQLTDNWVYRVIAKVGSYNQIYYRSFKCDYAACDLRSEAALQAYINSNELWPNKLFKHNAQKPGMLVVPRF